MIQIKVRLYSTLREYLPQVKAGESYPMNADKGTTIGDILRSLGVPEGYAKQAFVNGEAVELSYAVADGDDVKVFPPVAGGSPGDKANAAAKWPPRHNGGH